MGASGGWDLGPAWPATQWIPHYLSRGRLAIPGAEV